MRIAEPAAGLSPVALALRLTLLEILLRPAAAWPLRTALLVLAGLALVHGRLLLAPLTWLLLAALAGLRLVVDWPLADNHAYLLAYWCLAVALAALVADAHRSLASSARWLVGLAFAFAVLWKAFLSPDYLDGRFFRVTLIQDPRFADVAMLLGGLSPEELEENRESLEPLPEGAELVDARVLVEPPAFRRLAGALTWGGLALEALVAAAFLLPARPLRAPCGAAPLLCHHLRVRTGRRLRLPAAGARARADEPCRARARARSTWPPSSWC